MVVKTILKRGLEILVVIAVVSTGVHYWDTYHQGRAVDACTAEVTDFEHRHPRKDENGNAETYNDYNARIPAETTQCMARKGYELYNNTSFDCVGRVVADCYQRP
ncbi:hypothetical protein [Paraburkholderia phytofirmans]|uniref:hypothetical protein n=1 Tax=Paraburkholderia phytofirmans TaxID=261302 RepID=UPI0038B87B04